MTEIKHRWNATILATGETTRQAAESQKADLSGANLSGADLSGADLIAAYLRAANLRAANLSAAYLIGADLRAADLSRANLSAADLREADLSGADLRRADLSRADLSGADLRAADLSGATIPVIPAIDRAILTAVQTNGNTLEMILFHIFETTHCRAGWAIHLAGHNGYALEKQVGPCAAGALIYAASRPNLPVPDFYASNEAAMADLIACAATQA